MAKAMVDMAYDEADGRDAFEAAKTVGERYGIEVEVLVEHGPGGGWPEVALHGTRLQLESVLRVAWGMDDAQLEEEVDWED